MDKKYIFLTLNLHEIHWALVIVMPQTFTNAIKSDQSIKSYNFIF